VRLVDAHGSSKLLARITDRLPSRTQVVGLTPWTVFVMVSLELLKWHQKSIPMTCTEVPFP
jgi:hypothetical protein